MASRDTEKFASVVKPPYKMLVETFNGPSSYTTGGEPLKSTLLKVVERATALQGTGGFRGEVVTGSISGNQFKLKVWTGTSQVNSGGDLSAQAFSVLVEGLS